MNTPLRKLFCVQVEKDLLWNQGEKAWELVVDGRRFPVGMIWLQGDIQARPKFDMDSFEDGGHVWEVDISDGTGTVTMSADTAEVPLVTETPVNAYGGVLMEPTEQREQSQLHFVCKNLSFMDERLRKLWKKEVEHYKVWLTNSNK